MLLQAAPHSPLLSLEPELQVQVLSGLGPADLRSARLACRGLRCLTDTHVVTGLELQVVRSRSSRGGGLRRREEDEEEEEGEEEYDEEYEREEEEYDEEYEGGEGEEEYDEEGDEEYEEEEMLDVQEWSRRLAPIRGTLRSREQQSLATLRRLGRQLGKVKEGLRANFPEDSGFWDINGADFFGCAEDYEEQQDPQLEQQINRLRKQVTKMSREIGRQLVCMATAEEAVAQLLQARFPSLHRLTLGAARGCVLDGAALSAVLEAAPLGQLKRLSLRRCCLNIAVLAQLDRILGGGACCLDLGLDLMSGLTTTWTPCGGSSRCYGRSVQVSGRRAREGVCSGYTVSVPA